MQQKLNTGSESFLASCEMEGTTCPNCGVANKLSYGMKELAISEDEEITTFVEGMSCPECDFFFMVDEEITRYFNVRAVHEKSKLRFLLYEGQISQVFVH